MTRRHIPLSQGEKEGCMLQTEKCDKSKKVCFTAAPGYNKMVCTPQPPKKECAYTQVNCATRNGHKGEHDEGGKCFDVLKCTEIPQPDKCIQVRVPPVVECQPILCPPSPSDVLDENCFFSNITNISQQIVEQCEVLQEKVCENQKTEICEGVPQTTCKECKTHPKVTKECRTKPTKECIIVEKTVVEPQVEEICEEKCSDITNEVCRKEPYQKCKTEKEEVIKLVPQEYCFDKNGQVTLVQDGKRTKVTNVTHKRSQLP